MSAPSEVMVETLPVPSYPYRVFVMGDPTLEMYLHGETQFGPSPRFYVQTTEAKAGGAANVLNNLRVMLPANVLVHPLYEPVQDRWLRATHFVRRGNIQGVGYIDCPMEKVGSFYQGPLLDWLEVLSGRSGLVISNRQFGMCTTPLTSRQLKVLNESTPFEFIVVDGGWDVANLPDWLGHSRKKLLHVSGPEWGQHSNEQLMSFDYILYTDGPRPGMVYKPNSELGEVVPLATFGGDGSRVSVVDTTGAGDTFVAGVAAVLATHALQAWDDSLIIKACEFATEQARRVVGKLGPATP